MAGAQTTAPSAEQLLRGQGVRATPQRVRVLAELLGEPNDLTAQQLHDRLRAGGGAIGLATVYRTLDALVDAELVEPLNHFRDARCYRVCHEGHHHHLVCSRCHSIAELRDCSLEAPLARAAAEHGFLATGHELEVTGVCAACREGGAAATG
jgi:Fur family transcriptional regulator, ferric uptake regulator